MKLKNKYSFDYIVNGTTTICFVRVLIPDYNIVKYNRIGFDLKSKEIVPNTFRLEFKGVAKLNSEDEYNEEIGKKIAKNKALKKANSYFKSKFKEIRNMLENTIEEIDSVCENIDKRIESSDNTVQKLSFLKTE